MAFRYSRQLPGAGSFWNPPLAPTTPPPARQPPPAPTAPRNPWEANNYTWQRPSGDQINSMEQAGIDVWNQRPTGDQFAQAAALTQGASGMGTPPTTTYNPVSQTQANAIQQSGGNLTTTPTANQLQQAAQATVPTAPTASTANTIRSASAQPSVEDLLAGKTLSTMQGSTSPLKLTTASPQTLTTASQLSPTALTSLSSVLKPTPTTSQLTSAADVYARRPTTTAAMPASQAAQTITAASPQPTTSQLAQGRTVQQPVGQTPLQLSSSDIGQTQQGFTIDTSKYNPIIGEAEQVAENKAQGQANADAVLGNAAKWGEAFYKTAGTQHDYLNAIGNSAQMELANQAFMNQNIGQARAGYLSQAAKDAQAQFMGLGAEQQAAYSNLGAQGMNYASNLAAEQQAALSGLATSGMQYAADLGQSTTAGAQALANAGQQYAAGQGAAKEAYYSQGGNETASMIQAAGEAEAARLAGLGQQGLSGQLGTAAFQEGIGQQMAGQAALYDARMTPQLDQALAGSARGLQTGLTLDAAQQAALYGQRTTPQLGIEGTQAAAGTQADALSRLRQFADAPAGPSVAEAQLRLGGEQAMAQQLAAMRSGRGTGVTSAGRQQALEANAATMGRLNRETALLRAQEAATRREQDLSALTTEQQVAQSARQASLAEALGVADVGLRGIGLNDQASVAMQQAALQGAGQLRGADLSQAQAAAQVGLEGMSVNDQAAIASRGQQLEALGLANQSRGQGLGYDQALQQTAAQTGLGYMSTGADYSKALQGIAAQTGLGYDQMGLQYSQALNQAALQNQQAYTDMGLGYSQGMEGLAAQQLTALTGMGMSYDQALQQIGANQMNQMAGLGVQSSLGLEGLSNEAGMGYAGLAQQGLSDSYAQHIAAQQAAGQFAMQGISAAQGAQIDAYNVLLQDANIAAGLQAQNLQSNTQMAGAGMTAAGALLAGLAVASDVRAKEDIKPMRGDRVSQALGMMGNAFGPGGKPIMDIFQAGAARDRANQAAGTAAGQAAYDAGASRELGRVPAYQYQYKPEAQRTLGQPGGPQIGMMAQDMEQQPMLRSAVREGPGGMKMIDPGKLSMLTASAVGEQERRLSSLEQGQGSKYEDALQRVRRLAGRAA